MAKLNDMSIWSLPFVILMATNFFQSMAAFSVNTTLPVYAHELGASSSMVGIVVGSFAISALLVRPIVGPAFDSFSRKRFLIISQAMICVSLVLYGLVDNLGLLIAVRLLHGIGIGCSGPLAMSLVSEFLPPTKFSSGISIYTLAQSFAQVIGPAVGLYLVEAVGFSVSYYIAAACLLVAMIGIFAIKEPPRELLPYELKISRMFAREALSKAIALMLLATSFSCMTAYVVLYGYALGVDNLGMYFTVYAACLVLTRPVFGKLSDRFGAPRLLFFGILFFASSYIALHCAHDFGGFMLAAVLGSAGFGSCAPLLQSLALSSVPSDHRGAASNTTYTGLDLGMLIGPILGGFVIETLAGMTGSQALAYADMWLVMLIPAAGTFAIVVYWNLRKAKP